MIPPPSSAHERTTALQYCRSLSDSCARTADSLRHLLHWCLPRFLQYVESIYLIYRQYCRLPILLAVVAAAVAFIPPLRHQRLDVMALVEHCPLTLLSRLDGSDQCCPVCLCLGMWWCYKCGRPCVTWCCCKTLALRRIPCLLKRHTVCNVMPWHTVIADGGCTGV